MLNGLNLGKIWDNPHDIELLASVYYLYKVLKLANPRKLWQRINILKQGRFKEKQIERGIERLKTLGLMG